MGRDGEVATTSGLLPPPPLRGSDADAPPSPLVTEKPPRCSRCGVGGELRRCGRCRASLYCSAECQQADWKAGHRRECGRARQELLAPTPNAPSGGAAASDQVRPVDRQSPSGAAAAPAQARPGQSPSGAAAAPAQARPVDPRSAAAVKALVKEAADWCLPQSPDTEVHEVAAFLRHADTDGLVETLMRAQAEDVWTEHHSSGLLDRRDRALPAGSQELQARLSERVAYFALGEWLEREGRTGDACGAFARAACSSDGWAQAYRRWADCLNKAGRERDVATVLALAVERGVWQHPLQRPSDLYVPGLRASPFWDTGELPAARALEAAFPAILKEFRALRADAEAWRWTGVADQPLVVRGNWSDFKLVENGRRHPVNCARCPETVRAVQERCPEIATQVKGSLIFSHLSGGTVIRPHCGPTNTRIRLHLALEVPDDPKPRIRVGETWRTWEEGMCLAFDDSFEHEVVHEGPDSRVVLIADVWHPDFPDEMRRRHLHGQHLRRYCAAGAAGDGAQREYDEHPVDPVEVYFLEQELRGMPEVVEAAATVHRDAEGRQTLLAYAECAAGPGRTPADVCGLCAERLRACGLGSLVLPVTSWPRRADGSVDRGRLPPPPAALLADEARRLPPQGGGV